MLTIIHTDNHFLNRCRAKFMTCEIHDYDRSAHAHTMRMIDIGSEISQVDNNSTCVSCFGGNLCSFLKSCGFNFELSINRWDYHVYIACIVCIVRSV